MIFKLEIECVNAAFDDNPAPELARILEWVVNDLTHGRTIPTMLYDINGNVVGSYQLATHIKARRFYQVDIDFLADAFASKNPRFDRAKFIKACGVETDD